MMDAALSSRRVNIVQGEYHTTNDPEVVLTTILGSCVAACLHDPVARLGGMNHFLLPGERDPGDSEARRARDGAAGQRHAEAAAPGATGWRPSCSAAPAC